MAKSRDVVPDNLPVPPPFYRQATSNAAFECWLPANKKFTRFIPS
jgi:hypothetical protein